MTSYFRTVDSFEETSHGLTSMSAETVVQLDRLRLLFEQSEQKYRIQTLEKPRFGKAIGTCLSGKE